MKLIQKTKINYLFVISITMFLSWAYFSNNSDNRFVSATNNAIESVVTVLPIVATDPMQIIVLVLELFFRRWLYCYKQSYYK